MARKSYDDYRLAVAALAETATHLVGGCWRQHLQVREGRDDLPDPFELRWRQLAQGLEFECSLTIIAVIDSRLHFDVAARALRQQSGHSWLALRQHLLIEAIRQKVPSAMLIRGIPGNRVRVSILLQK